MMSFFSTDKLLLSVSGVPGFDHGNSAVGNGTEPMLEQFSSSWRWFASAGGRFPSAAE